ncbi:single-stranded DNA-binding protein [Microbacterium sp. P26]|uniref:single-stranded DNA-binding protein n=1 Tax=Microbacterium TaxID=33882 RepID=UPI00204222EC|nr:single-stranded DNA-binding protein [Microbacterium sp. P26]MCM3501679.1 single-stranded DNA-binding protein [Microbacterium sp. P26]
MSDHITLVGNITGELDQRATRGGEPIAAFRLAVGERKLDRERGEWVDGHTNFYNVSVFGDLGAHALASLRKGQRVILTGRLRVREWENETKRGVSADVVVDAIGHDLRWGTSQFTRTPRPQTAVATSVQAEASTPVTDADGWAIPGAETETASPDADESRQPALVGAEGEASPF